MSYELAIAPEAEDDLDRLISSLPKKRRAAALDAVLEQLDKLASNPSLAVRSTLGRPTYRFQFVVHGVHYPLGGDLQVR
jgi:hypothetical protein